MADVNIICATGIYTAMSRPAEFMGKSEEYMISHFEKEINEGMDGTDIRPGFLKCAINVLTQNNKIDESVLTSLRACAKLAAKNDHNAFPLTSDHILSAVDIVLNECGVKPDRLLMMHMDSFLRTPTKIIDYVSTYDTVRSVNTDPQEKLLEKGVNLGFDSWTSLVNTLPDDYDRLKGLVNLLKKGYASQIVLGHDTAVKAQGVSYGYYGFTGFAGFVLPILKQLNFEDDVINKLTVENPGRILAY